MRGKLDIRDLIGLCGGCKSLALMWGPCGAYHIFVN